jgi:hypothetical protein
MWASVVKVFGMESALLYAVFAAQLYVICNLIHVSQEGKLRSKTA